MGVEKEMRPYRIVLGGKDYAPLAAEAIEFFWTTKERQLMQSGGASNRGAVVGGKQMDGFIGLLRAVAVGAGVPAECVITQQNYLPGYFRSSKDWDMLVISPKGKLVAALELKSQVGSYGNNFNNRIEEAIGSAVDLWTAFREGQFPGQAAPWVGWLMVVGRDEASLRAVRNLRLISPSVPSSRERVIWSVIAFFARSWSVNGIIRLRLCSGQAVRTVTGMSRKRLP